LARTVGPSLGISKRARLNLAAAMPELSRGEIDRIVRGMWDNLGRVIAEYPHLPDIKVFAPSGRVEAIGFENADRAVAEGRPAIFFAGHLANWEIAAMSPMQHGMDIAQIYRAANNPLVDRMITRFRVWTGELIPKGAEGSRRALAALRNGRSLGMLADQKLNNGIAVPFFGRPAMTTPVLAAFALRFNCAVLPSRMERLGGARFRLTIEPPLDLPRTGDKNADIMTLMTAVNGKLEDWIRARPEQWLWLHRRWSD